MAQESLRARGEPVRTRLEYDDEVAGLRFREVHPVGEEIERRAERSHDGRGLPPGAYDPIADFDRIVFADDLAEVAGRREMVMQAAVGHEEYVAARNFPVDDAADVDAGRSDQIAAELDHEPRLRQRFCALGHEIFEIRAYRGE